MENTIARNDANNYITNVYLKNLKYIYINQESKNYWLSYQLEHKKKGGSYHGNKSKTNVYADQRHLLFLFEYENKLYFF